MKIKLTMDITISFRENGKLIFFKKVACLVVGNFAFLFNCMLVGQTSHSMTVLT